MREFVELPFGIGHLLLAFDDNRLFDVLYLGTGRDDIGAIHRARVGRPIKGLGGVFIDFADGSQGFLRSKAAPPTGAMINVQIKQTVGDKPARVSDVIDYRGAFVVLTPDRPGLNLSKSLGRNALEPDAHARLTNMLPRGVGAIIRSNARFADFETLESELNGLIKQYERVEGARERGLILPALTGGARAAIEWGDGVFQPIARLSEHHAEALRLALAMPMGAAGGEVRVERTHALIAVDIDTGVNTAPTAGRDVNMAAIGRIADALAWLGWGGQLVIDPAPMPQPARKGFEVGLAKAAKAAGLAIIPHGFGPMGLFEAQIRYSRRPLPADFLARLGSE